MSSSLDSDGDEESVKTLQLYQWGLSYGETGATRVFKVDHDQCVCGKLIRTESYWQKRSEDELKDKRIQGSISTKLAKQVMMKSTGIELRGEMILF